MSYYDRADSSRSARGRRPPPQAAAWDSAPLSNLQKAKLSIASRKAWDAQSRAGLAEGDFDEWRKAQTRVACGFAGFRLASNKHFRSILAHFKRLGGNTREADALWSRTGRVAGSEQIHDTHENRETARALIRDLISASRGLISEAYVAPILRDRFAGKGLHELTALDLQQLFYTLRARLRKMIPR
jgi:hypothetical protein